MPGGCLLSKGTVGSFWSCLSRARRGMHVGSLRCKAFGHVRSAAHFSPWDFESRSSCLVIWAIGAWRQGDVMCPRTWSNVFLLSVLTGSWRGRKKTAWYLWRSLELSKETEAGGWHRFYWDKQPCPAQGKVSKAESQHGCSTREVLGNGGGWSEHPLEKCRCPSTQRPQFYHTPIAGTEKDQSKAKQEAHQQCQEQTLSELSAPSTLIPDFGGSTPWWV